VARLGFGVDIGGSGIKGAVVDLDAGTLASERYKVLTPQPSTPQAVAGAVAEVVRHFGWQDRVGCTFPAVVQAGVARTAANVDPSWVGTSVEQVVAAATGLPVSVVNDADAAGVAEATWGAAKGVSGLVVVVTLGTGIGTALIYRGLLVPNSELGHIELDGVDYETKASAAAREREGLSWEKWAKRLQRYFSALEFYLRPEMFVVGGGVSRRAEKFLPLLKLDARLVSAHFQNEAGIIGAAYNASLQGESTGATSRCAPPAQAGPVQGEGPAAAAWAATG
jgi:polyphosphate glucokinase